MSLVAWLLKQEQPGFFFHLEHPSLHTKQVALVRKSSQ